MSPLWLGRERALGEWGTHSPGISVGEQGCRCEAGRCQTSDPSVWRLGYLKKVLNRGRSCTWEVKEPSQPKAIWREFPSSGVEAPQLSWGSGEGEHQE